MVSFLIDDKSFSAMTDDFSVLIIFHRPDFERECRNEWLERVEAVLQITLGNKLRVFTCDEENITKS